MWPHKDAKYLQPSAYSRRSTSYIDREFQVKFIRHTLVVLITSTLVFILPALMYAYENYEIFLKIADKVNPELSNHISRERAMLTIVFAGCALGAILYWVIISKKLTAKIAGPLKILRNHIRLLSRGDLSLSPITLRDDDEFKELISSYNYFYALLKAQMQRDLADLKLLKEQTHQQSAIDILNRMIEDRALRLHQNNDVPYTKLSPLNDATHDATDDSRHAS